MKHARDLMSPNPTVCSVDETLEKLLEKFLATGFKYIPVTDKNDNCIGMMDELGLIRALSDKTTDPNKAKLEEYSNLFIEARFVDANANIGELMPELLKSPSKRVIVNSGSKKPLGIMSPSNILKAAVGARPQSKAMKESLDKTSDHAEKNWVGTVTADIFKEAFLKSPYIMILTDNEGQIIDSNDRFEKVLGFQKHNFEGKHITSIFPSFAHHKIANAMLKARNLGRCPTQPTAVVRETGPFLNMDMAFSGIRDEDQRLKYYCCVLRVLSGNEFSHEDF